MALFMQQMIPHHANAVNMAKVLYSPRRDCHSATHPCTSARCFGRDTQGGNQGDNQGDNQGVPSQ